MVERNDSIIVGTALTGGAAGALYGYKTAPSVLGKVDVDAVLQRKIDTDIVRDKILKEMGEASKDFFEKSRNNWYGIEQAVPNDAAMFFENVTPDKDGNVTVKQFKDAIAEGKIRSCKANGVEQIENYKKALEKMDDTVKLSREGLKNLMRENHSMYNAAKKDIETLIERAPKLTSKYALGFGVVGAAVLGVLAMIGTAFSKNSSEETE